jgi:hypothetical protein
MVLRGTVFVWGEGGALLLADVWKAGAQVPLHSVLRGVCAGPWHYGIESVPACLGALRCIAYVLGMP